MSDTLRNDRRLLIVNADDFGQSRGINEGICEAFEKGIVTSASLMVRCEAGVEAARYSREHPDLSVGLHVDFGEWVYRNGNWVPLYEVLPTRDERAVYQELWRQLERFHDLIRRAPTHLDSHQHVHRSGAIRDIFADAAETIGVPLRDSNGSVRYCGAFYGQTDDGRPLPENITVTALSRIVDGLVPGFTELGCHPAKSVDMDFSYGEERIEEFMMLSDPALRLLLNEKAVELCSFHDVLGAAK